MRIYPHGDRNLSSAARIFVSQRSRRNVPAVAADAGPGLRTCRDWPRYPAGRGAGLRLASRLAVPQVPQRLARLAPGIAVPQVLQGLRALRPVSPSRRSRIAASALRPTSPCRRSRSAASALRPVSLSRKSSAGHLWPCPVPFGGLPAPQPGSRAIRGHVYDYDRRRCLAGRLAMSWRR